MLGIFFAAALAFLCTLIYQKRAKLPPGPIPFPLLGNIPQLGWLVVRHGGVVNAMKELKKTYGPIFTIWMGPQPTVHICSLELAHDTMVKRGGEFVDRWLPSIVNAVSQGRGIIQSNGQIWLEQRRFALQTLRNFGLGRGIMEERIMMELNYRFQLLDKDLAEGRNEIEANYFFDLTVGSIINRMLLNERFEKDKEDEFFDLKRRLDNVNTTIQPFDCLYDYEFLRNLPWLKQRWEGLIATFYDLEEYMHKPVRERIAAIDRGDHVIADEPEDFMDAFLAKMKTEDPEKTTFKEKNLVINLFDLWAAGQETTSTTLLYGFHLLLKHPEVVEKAKKEVLKVTGGERHLSLKDKTETPYLNALTTFDPSRFLENDKLEQHVLPFGIGKRACPGESLARAEIYLIVGNMLLRYNIAPPTSEPLPSLKSATGFCKSTPRYKMTLTKIN